MHAVQFRFDGWSKRFSIYVSHAGAVVEVYIARSNDFLIYKMINDGYYRYDFTWGKITEIGVSLPPVVLNDVTRIPDIMARYEDIDFNAFVANLTSGERSMANPGYYATITDRNQLERGSRAIDYISRWAVAANPTTPSVILDRLADDSSYYVASEARKNLRARYQH